MIQKPLHTFIDKNQNFWQLAVIQSSAMGLPVILLGGELSKQFGMGNALTSILLGNIILWLVGLAMIGMSSQLKSNAIEMVRTYLGKIGAFFAALMTITAFLIWYAIQIRFSTTALITTFPEALTTIPGIELRIGAAIGVFIALITLKGIPTIKFICQVSFPFLYLYILYLMIHAHMFTHITPQWSFSLPGIIAVIGSLLPGIINIPTFFRHSRSIGHSVFALSLMTLFVISFQFFSVFSGISLPDEIFTLNQYTPHLFFTGLLNTLFVILSLICVNMVNIYFASAGWEMIVPVKSSGKEYAILGLIGTLIFTCIQLTFAMVFLETLITSFMSVLATVLLIDFIIRLVIKHRPRSLEKIVSLICWISGCIAAAFIQIHHPQNPSLPITTGISAATLTFLITLFIEETLWALRHKFSKHTTS